MTCPYAATTRYPKTKPTWKMTREELAKVYATENGWHTHTNGGGWIFAENEMPLIQGWTALADKLEKSGRIVVGRGISWNR